MLIVLFFVGLVVCTMGLYLIDEDSKWESMGALLVGIGFVTSFISMIVTIGFLVGFPYLVKDKLEMYQEENTKIEEKVKDTVRIYMNYEQETYDNMIKDADLMTLLVAYPELNSNELIKSELTVYIDNSNKIKELKEQLIMRSTMAWWLYFGN